MSADTKDIDESKKAKETISISVGQGLLLLINKYKHHEKAWKYLEQYKHKDFFTYDSIKKEQNVNKTFLESIQHELAKDKEEGLKFFSDIESLLKDKSFRDWFQKYNNYDDFMENLNKLYIAGAVNPKALADIQELFTDTALRNYNIPTDMKEAAPITDSDPTRRVFETLLSLNTVGDTIQKVPKELIDKIKGHFFNLLQKNKALSQETLLQENKNAGEIDQTFMLKLLEYIKEKKQIINKTNLLNANMEMGGKINEDALLRLLNRPLIKKIEQENTVFFHSINQILIGQNPAVSVGDKPLFGAEEYSDCLRRIDTDPNFSMSTLDKEKLKDIVRCCFLSVTVTNSWNDKISGELPLDLYSRSYFTTPMRGRESKNPEEQRTMETQHLGIIRSTMPIPSHSLLTTSQVFRFAKPSDNSRYSIEKLGAPNDNWVKHNFERLVHPFSNAISGTMLCNLRVLLKLQEDNKLFSADDLELFSNYMKTLIAMMQYNSGGHSLFEFIAPLELKDTQDNFRFMQGFKTINIDNLFFDSNKIAFNAAVEKAISYNDQILKRTQMIRGVKAITPFNIASTIRNSKFYAGDLTKYNLDFLKDNNALLGSRIKDGVEIFVLIQKRGKEIKETPLVISKNKDSISFDNFNFKIEHATKFDEALSQYFNEKKDNKLLTNIEFNDNFFNTYFDLLFKAQSMAEIRNLLGTPNGKIFAKAVNTQGHSALSLLLQNKFDVPEVIEELIKQGAHVNFCGPNGLTLLTQAMFEGNTPLVNLLVKHGANPNYININGYTTLTLAVISLADPKTKMELGNIQGLLDYPLFKGKKEKDNKEENEKEKKQKEDRPSINDKDINRKTALHYAASMKLQDEGTAKLINLLLENGASPGVHDAQGQTPLMYAVKYNNTEAVKALLYFKNNKDYKDGKMLLELVNKIDDYGNSAMMMAIQNGHLNILVELLNCQDKLDIKSSEGETPLDIKNFEGETPLTTAIKTHQFEMAELLLKRNPNLLKADGQGNNILMLLIANQQSSIANKLLSEIHGPNKVLKIMKDKNKNGQNALHISILAGNLDMVKKCIEAGVDAASKDKEGHSPLMLAAACGRLDIANYLLKNKTVVNDINEISQFNETALTLAVKEGNLALVKSLLIKDANTNQPLNTNNLPLLIAMQANNYDLVIELLNYGANPLLKGADGRNILSIAQKDYYINPLIISAVMRKFPDQSQPSVIFSMGLSPANKRTALSLDTTLEHEQDTTLEHETKLEQGKPPALDTKDDTKRKQEKTHKAPHPRTPTSRTPPTPRA